MAAGPVRRRADLATDEAQDVRDAAHKLTRIVDAALEDGTVSPDEARAIAEQARRTFREAAQVVVATEWTSVGELQAVAKLTGRDSTNAMIREMDVRKRAAEVGLSLTA